MTGVKLFRHYHLLTVLLSATALVLAFLLLATNNLLALPFNIRGTSSLGKKLCNTNGAPVINITQKVVNSIDSGQAGNYWAFDNFNRQIKVYRQSDNSFCALVDYEGKFDSQTGQKSPGNTGVLTGAEDGTFKGGYRATIIGTLIPNPSLPQQGGIGTVDYKCDLSGNCPESFSWIEKYFGGSTVDTTFTYQWWGWQYQYKNHTWTNSSDGNSGDVI